MSGGLVRLTAVVAVAGALAIIAGFSLRLAHFGLWLGPWELLPSSCITWLVLARAVRGRGRLTTALLGIFSVVLIVALTILIRLCLAAVSAPESATASQLGEALSLMLAMQLLPYIMFTSWATIPAGIITAFFVRWIMAQRSNPVVK